MNLKKNNISGLDPQQNEIKNKVQKKRLRRQKMDYWLNSLLVNVATRDDQD